MDSDEEREADAMYEPLPEGDAEQDTAFGNRFGVVPRQQQGLGDDDVLPMDENKDEVPQQQEEEDVSDEVFRIEALELPEPNPRIVYGERKQHFHFASDHIPLTLPVIPPQILKGLTSSVMDTNVKIKALTCIHKALPMPVHGSPLVSLFMTRVRTKGGPTPSKPTCVSWMDTCCQLLQFKAACGQGYIEFHKDIKPEILKKAEADYQDQVYLMETSHNNFMDSLYQGIRSGEIQGPQALNQFASALETYSVRYIHLLEWYLWTCLVAPHGLPLDAVLTPWNGWTRDMTLEQTHDAGRARNLVVDFFRFKVPLVVEHIKSYGEANASEAAQISRTIDLEQLPFRIQVSGTTGQIKYNCQQGKVWKGYISAQTLYEYLLFCDVRGVLRKAGWEWHP